jgi:hypothetical protein
VQKVFHAQHCTQAPAQQQASPIFKRLPSAPSSHTTPPDALKKYNKVQMEELSPDAIAAARMRRSRER